MPRACLYSLNVKIFHSLFLNILKTNKTVMRHGSVKNLHDYFQSRLCRSTPTAFISGISGSSRRFVQYSRCIIYREQTSEGPFSVAQFLSGSSTHGVYIKYTSCFLSIKTYGPFLVWSHITSRYLKCNIAYTRSICLTTGNSCRMLKQ